MTYDTDVSPPRRNPAIRIGIIAAAVILVVFLAGRKLGWFGGGNGGAQAQTAGAGGPPGGMPPMPVDVDTARNDEVVDAVRATGRIEAIQSIELKPDESGRVVELTFREGQVVEAGAPLVKIDDALLRAQAERSRADSVLAQQQLLRVRRLRTENAAPSADLEEAEARARSATAALAVLSLQIERATVRAPFAGVIGQRFVSPGDYVTSSSRLLSLQTTDPQHAVIEVPERHAGSLRVGQSVEFSIAAQPERTFRGTVEFIDPAVNTTSRTILMKARAANPGRQLRAGMFIEARLATARRSNAVVVREDAVQPGRTGNVVWAVVDGKASRRVVRLGARSAGVVEILEGVRPGELVVVGGLERMQEGMAVAPRGGPPPQPQQGAAAPAPAAADTSRH